MTREGSPSHASTQRPPLTVRMQECGMRVGRTLTQTAPSLEHTEPPAGRALRGDGLLSRLPPSSCHRVGPVRLGEAELASVTQKWEDAWLFAGFLTPV